LQFSITNIQTTKLIYFIDSFVYKNLNLVVSFFVILFSHSPHSFSLSFLPPKISPPHILQPPSPSHVSHKPTHFSPLPHHRIHIHTKPNVPHPTSFSFSFLFFLLVADLVPHPIPPLFIFPLVADLVPKYLFSFFLWLQIWCRSQSLYQFDITILKNI
jgi:hypothetical protein